MPTHQRQGEPEARTLAGFTPRLQTALVQPGVLDADRQPEAGASGAPHPRRIGAPEAAEHQLLLARPQADAVVAHRDGDGVLVGRHADAHRLALGVVDGVGDEVAQDAFDAARIDLGDDGLVGHVDDQLDAGVLGEMADVVERALDRRAEILRFDRQLGDTRVVAGDLQQIGEQRLEPVQLVDHQLGGPRNAGSSSSLWS